MTVSDTVYGLCLPILSDDAVDDEDKTEKMELILRKDTALTGKALENAILDSMWRFRTAKDNTSSPPPTRHTVIRKSSPAPWQLARTSAFTRAKSSTPGSPSPFTSPRPSPRLTSPSLHIPHSPSLNAYEFSGQPSPATDEYEYGGYGSDTVDWLVNDDYASNASSFVAESGGGGGLNGAAAEWVPDQVPDQMDMYDMLRSILREDRPNEELERVLEANSYDLSATVSALMDGSAGDLLPPAAPANDVDRSYLVGKSMVPAFRPATPQGQMCTPVMCKYWLQSGHCARADCRFSHDPSKTICKYWMNGNCLAGETCLFSHDPSTLMQRMMIDGAQTPPTQSIQPNFQVQDYEVFPSLQRTISSSSNQLYHTAVEAASLEKLYGSSPNFVTSPPPGLNPFPQFLSRPSSRQHSRPNSRPVSRQGLRTATPSAPALDDAEAFPSLGSVAKAGKKHHGKRGGHGHGHKDSSVLTGSPGPVPSSLADVVRMSPSPSPAQRSRDLRARCSRTPSGLRDVGGASTPPSSGENSAAAMAIPPPEHVPWLETGSAANRAYLLARQQAFKHGAQRNKFLQSAAQAWNRNDTRAAKALSLRGQTENNMMKEAHREAARVLYEERNGEAGKKMGGEVYVDLHGLHPDEAIAYLSDKLVAHQDDSGGGGSRRIYAITGTGHHSKYGRDKVNKAVRAFLTEWRYAFREFSVPGDRNNVGGILGIEPGSWDRGLVARAGAGVGVGSASGSGGVGGVVIAGGAAKVRILKPGEVLAEAAEVLRRGGGGGGAGGEVESSGSSSS